MEKKKEVLGTMGRKQNLLSQSRHWYSPNRSYHSEPFSLVRPTETWERALMFETTYSQMPATWLLRGSKLLCPWDNRTAFHPLAFCIETFDQLSNSTPISHPALSILISSLPLSTYLSGTFVRTQWSSTFLMLCPVNTAFPFIWLPFISFLASA